MKCIRILQNGEPLTLFPEGERKDGPVVHPLFDGAAYVAAQRRRPDHSDRHRRLGPGDAAARQVHPPAQGVRGDRRADLGRESDGSDDPIQVRVTPGGASCDRAVVASNSSDCSTRPSPAWAEAQSVAAPRNSLSRRHEVARIVGTAQLAGRVHRQLRDADVDRGDAEPGRRHRPDGRSARHVVARDEHLPRHAGALARSLEHCGRLGRRGITLIGVDLDRRAGIDDRAVPGFVTFGVVRMHGVGVVGRDARRGRERPVKVVVRSLLGPTRSVTTRSAGTALPRRWRSPSRPPRGRSTRSLRWGPVGSDSLSAVAAAQHDSWLSSRPDARSDRSAPSTVAPCTSYRHSSHHVGGASVPAASPIHSANSPVGRGSRTPDRAQVLLWVEHEPDAVDLAIEMNGELRDAGDRLADIDQRRGAVDADDPPGHTEVAIEPAVVQDAAVHLDGELLPAVPAGIGMGLDP